MGKTQKLKTHIKVIKAMNVQWQGFMIILIFKKGNCRASVHASEDVRRGLITREQGFDLIKQYDVQRPHALDYYKKITGFTEEQIKKTITVARKKKANMQANFQNKNFKFSEFKKIKSKKFFAD